MSSKSKTPSLKSPGHDLVWFSPRGEPRLELGVHRLWNYVELFWNSLDKAPSSIVFYLEMKVEIGVHDIKSRFTSRFFPILKAALSESHFQYNAEVEQAVRQFLASLGIKFYQSGFFKLIARYDKCLNVGSDYVEK